MGCCNSAVIPAPVDDVWARLRDFHDLSAFPNVIESVESQGDANGTQIGAGRLLNGAIRETLIALDDEAHVVRYRIDDGPDAISKDNVQGYVGEVRAFPVTDTDQTFVLWTSSWASSSGGVVEFCDPIYRALLSDLKAAFS